MGLFDDIGGAVSNAGNSIRNATGLNNGGLIGTAIGGINGIGPLGTYLGQQAGNMFQNQNIQAPGIDPRMAAIQQQQLDQANQFKQYKPQLESDLYGAAERQARSGLAQQQSGITKDASRRGLLYGGNYQSNLSKAAANSANQLGLQGQNIHTAVGQEEQALDERAIQSGVSLAQLQQGAQDYTYQTALANAQSRLGALSSLGGGLGTIAGSALAGRVS